VIGEIERVKLNTSDKLKRVTLSQSSQLKGSKPDSLNNPLKVFTQGNAMVVVDGKICVIQIVKRLGWSVNPSMEPLTFQIWLGIR